MKSYTDLEQSKKLTKILSDETADFVWLIGRLHTDGPRYEVIRTRNEVSEPETCWPCWSLAALLGVLPYPTLHQQRDEAWGLDVWVEQVYPYSVNNAICEVDACYKMILKLHEQKLL